MNAKEKCAADEHDYMPPVFGVVRIKTGLFTFNDAGSFVSVCRKCGDTVERLLEIKVKNVPVVPGV